MMPSPQYAERVELFGKLNADDAENSPTYAAYLDRLAPAMRAMTSEQKEASEEEARLARLPFRYNVAEIRAGRAA
jgi:hypothetical protein